MSDMVDANLISFFFGERSVENVISSKIQTCDRLADFYNVTHRNRGVALIFNHAVFDDKSLREREGTEKDRDYLEKVLLNLGFDVRVYNDLNYADMYQILYKVAEEDHTHADCLLICVMSHGEVGKINAKDHAYPPDVLWLPFVGDKCQTLAGKPKMFFIQACRGSDVDGGVTMKARIETDSAKRDDPYVYSIPAMADIMVMYSTYQGYFSWRSPNNGSWFIQALCKELEENWNRCDLLTMLTFVNRRVGILHQSNVPGDKNMNKKKQICTIVSMLTRLVIFPPKQGKESSTDSVQAGLSGEPTLETKTN